MEIRIIFIFSAITCRPSHPVQTLPNTAPPPPPPTP